MPGSGAPRRRLALRPLQAVRPRQPASPGSLFFARAVPRRGDAALQQQQQLRLLAVLVCCSVARWRALAAARKATPPHSLATLSRFIIIQSHASYRAHVRRVLHTAAPWLGRGRRHARDVQPARELNSHKTRASWPARGRDAGLEARARGAALAAAAARQVRSFAAPALRARRFSAAAPAADAPVCHTPTALRRSSSSGTCHGKPPTVRAARPSCRGRP